MNLPRLAAPASAAAPARPMSPSKAPSDDAQAVRYVAARYMGMSPASAAHMFALTTKQAAALELSIDAARGSTLRRRHQGCTEGRGRQAELSMLRSAIGDTLAARMVSIPIQDVRLLDSWLLPLARVRRAAMPIDELCAQLRRCAGLLPMSVGLWVQTGPGRLDADGQTQLNKLKPRVRFGGVERDVGAMPRVTVIDSSEPDNRVRRARLTALTRCLIEAALAVRAAYGGALR